jgi:hypothetical protein
VKTRSKLAETSKKARAQIGPFFQLLLLLWWWWYMKVTALWDVLPTFWR